MIDTTKEQQALADALSACEYLSDPEHRDLLMKELGEIKSAVRRFSDTRSDLRSTVATCVGYADGIARLQQVVAYYVRSEELEPVKQCAAILIEKLNAGRAAAAVAIQPLTSGPDAPADVIDTVPALAEQRFALVIGISNYQHQQLPGNELGEKDFVRLSFAADDAEEIYKTVKAQGYTEPIVLKNHDATLSQIMHAFDELGKKCKHAENPFVLVFFSGHGARDEAERHYLIPHDGRRDDLFATALWCKTFDNVLSELNTNKLTVFLDACHGGAFAAQGIKGNPFTQIDTQSLVGLPSAYVIASCMQGQNSRELNGHGIFTGHLLQVLRCEVDDFSDDEGDLRGVEEIDVWDSYRVLRKKVPETAKRECNGAIQVPIARWKGPTGITLAVNEQLRRVRIEKEMRFCAAIVDELRKDRYKPSELIGEALELFILKGITDRAPEGFYMYFQQSAARWQEQDRLYVSRTSETLYKRHDSKETSIRTPLRGSLPGPAISIAGAAPSSANVSSPSAVAKPADSTQFETGPRYQGRSTQASGPPPVGPLVSAGDQRRKERRLFSLADQRHVVEPIYRLELSDEAESLRELLNGREGVSGVSEDDFTVWLVDTEPGNQEAKALWKEQKKEVKRRFVETWGKYQPHSALSIRAGGDH